MIDIYKSLYFQVKAKQYAFDAITLQSDIKPLVDHVLLDNDVLQCLRHVNVSEEYYIKHAVNVSVLAAITAKWMNMDSETIYSVALAGLLHDIGKALVDHNILFKPDRLSAYEMSNMKEHSKFGYEVIKNNPTVPREVLAAVLFHHERSDGNGYPSGLTEEQTPFLARIIAVADVFDAITSDRVYKEKVSSFKAFSIIKDESFRGLDPRVCEVFLSNIATFFVNNRVKLNDGRIGDVVYINKYALNRPLVRVNNEFVDLSMDYSVDIEDVL
jgi:putative nucleotidyltransferase with HDIG domain